MCTSNLDFGCTAKINSGKGADLPWFAEHTIGLLLLNMVATAVEVDLDQWFCQYEAFFDGFLVLGEPYSKPLTWVHNRPDFLSKVSEKYVKTFEQDY